VSPSPLRALRKARAWLRAEWAFPRVRLRRRRFSPLLSAAAIISITLALASSCRTVPRSQPTGPDRPPAVRPPIAQRASPSPEAQAVEANLEKPIVRVGLLTEVGRASLSADGGLVVRGRVSAQDPLRDIKVQRATFTGLSPAASTRTFRVQVASLADLATAQDTARRAQTAVNAESVVQWNAETRSNQVRVGGLATREEAQVLLGKLHMAGFPGGWIVEEGGAALSGRLRLVETGDELAVATIFPARAGDEIAVDGLPYRGLFEVRAAQGGGLTVVNVLNLEDYLRGVVPNELSPTAFGHLEALKAQAVAARTYVLRNLGQFAARGYDICATPTCQVYRGRSTEHPLSDQAVLETRGLAASHRGQLINALYTSTCGGHTEQGSNIFDGEPTPYLVGVSCAPEREAWASLRTTTLPAALGDEPGLNRDAALLVALGVLEPRQYSAAGVTGMATEAELRGWVTRLVAALDRKGCPSPVNDGLARRGAFFHHLVASLCWEERGQRLLAPGDADYLLSVEDRAELVREPERIAVATLVQEGVLSLFPDNTVRPGATTTRSQAVTSLARAALAMKPPGLVSAEFRGMAAGGVIVREGEDEPERTYPVDPGVRLFRALDGSRLAASELDLAAGDKVRFVLHNGRVSYLEAEQSLLGASADRTSKVYRWEVRSTPGDLAKTMARFGSVGAVKDVQPRRYGVSGRVIELAVIGSEGEMPLRGLRVRWGLGLRENLFVIDRERDAQGNVRRFVFTGKGWGHGVGLCQVGAFGMAQSGSTYDRILRHYYSGITLARRY
jgi:stage II sporulation protein D